MANVRFAKPIEFEIPLGWWLKSGISGFRPNSNAYASTDNSEWPTAIIRISEIVPPRRADGVRWFDQNRMTAILKCLAKGVPIPPIEVHELPAPNACRYGLRDGFHRFFASAAAGFECVPVEIRPYFNVGEWLGR